MASNLGGGWHEHLALTMTTYEYMEQTGSVFVPEHNTGNYQPTMRTAQEQALLTKSFRQNQALFRRYTAMDEALKI